MERVHSDGAIPPGQKYFLLMPSISQSFHKLRVFHWPKLSVENSTPPEYTPTCSIQRLVVLQTQGTGSREAGCVWQAVFSAWQAVFGGWRVACGRWRVAGNGWRAAEIMTSVDIIV